jgi:uncharacterized protein (TIGR03083 family)
MHYQLYVESQRRVEDLVGALDPAALDVLTPACPAWSVRDVLAHLAGGIASFGAESYAGAGTDAWAAEHVESRRDVPVADLLAERRACSARLEGLPADHRAWLPAVHDALSHEADIRGALGAPGLPADALAAAFPLLQPVLRSKLGKLGPTTLELDGQPHAFGAGEPVLLAQAPLFEFWRGAFGRRSDRQLRSWVLSGDAEAFAKVLPLFPSRATDLLEPA